MRFGAPVFGNVKDPLEWAAAHKKRGYNAAYSPINDVDSLNEKVGFLKAAAENDIVIAEVGAWSNPLSPDAAEREAAVKNCIDKLVIADEINARCCVNIAGNMGSGGWDSHSPENYSDAAFDAVVESVRKIIDGAAPKRSYYTLEMMPWMLPYDAESYLELIKAVDRAQFAVHLDIVNIINNPYRYYHTADITKNIFKILGSYIKSIHVKDIILSTGLTVHLDEIIPGKGNFNHAALVSEVKSLNPDIPLMLEHLHAEDDYIAAGDYFKAFF